MRYQFIYHSKESRFSKLETYHVYDTKYQEYVYDIYNNVCCVSIDRDERIIYFYGMHVDSHWILEKYYYDIIEEFINLAELYDIIGYKIDEECVGGQIYYKYIK